MSVSEKVTSPDRYAQEFGDLSEAKKTEIIIVLRTFMKELREVLDSTHTVHLVRAVFPDIEPKCATCAFNPATDGLKGFAPTAYGLLWSILYDGVFLCHGEDPNWKGQHAIDPENLSLCNGFHSVRLFGGQKTSLIATQAMQSIRKIAGKK